MVTLQKHHYTNNPTTKMHSLLRMLQYLWHGRVVWQMTCFLLSIPIIIFFFLQYTTGKMGSGLFDQYCRMRT